MIVKDILIFVYGTLRRNEENYYLLQNEQCIAQQCWTNGLLYDTSEGYPALKGTTKGKVYGELYLVDKEKLQELDRLEDYNGPGQKNLYNRIKQQVYTDNGAFEAFVYTIAPDYQHLLAQQIDYGDWCIHHSFVENPTFYYFAYGSCMDHERFRLDGVDHFFQNNKGVGILEGYRLRYTRKVSDGGRADIVEEEGDVVEGIVYEVPGACLPYLYRREGVKYKSYRPGLIDVTVNGQLLKNVLTFLVVNKDKETAPPIDYAIEIIRGGTGILSDGYIQKLKQQLKDFNLIL